MFPIKSTITCLLSAASVVAWLLPATVNAHHGWSWYQGDEEAELTGTVVLTDFRNPHDRIVISVDGQEWDVLFGPPSRNRRAGLGPDSVHLGDEVTIYGHRHAEPGRFEMKTERIRVGDSVFNLYPERK